MKDVGCWLCRHRVVCKYWEIAQQQHFPFKSDSEIEPFLVGIAEVYAKACDCFLPKESE